MANLKCKIYREWDPEEEKWIDSNDETVYEIVYFFSHTFLTKIYSYAILLNRETGYLKNEKIEHLKVINK